MLFTMMFPAQPLNFFWKFVFSVVALNIGVAADFAWLALQPAQPLVAVRHIPCSNLLFLLWREVTVRLPVIAHVLGVARAAIALSNPIILVAAL